MDDNKGMKQLFKEHVMESKQLEKCINYILKNQNVPEANYDASIL